MQTLLTHLQMLSLLNNKLILEDTMDMVVAGEVEADGIMDMDGDITKMIKTGGLVL